MGDNPCNRVKRPPLIIVQCAYIFVPSFDLLIGREGNIFFYNREAVREFLSIITVPHRYISINN